MTTHDTKNRLNRYSNLASSGMATTTASITGAVCMIFTAGMHGEIIHGTLDFEGAWAEWEGTGEWIFPSFTIPGPTGADYHIEMTLKNGAYSTNSQIYRRGGIYFGQAMMAHEGDGARRFGSDTLVASTADWNQGGLLNQVRFTNPNTMTESVGNWTADDARGFAGITLSDADNNKYYGWLDVEYIPPFSGDDDMPWGGVKIHAWAYESDANVGIMAGSTGDLGGGDPVPGGAGLALLALGGAGTRRSRRR